MSTVLTVIIAFLAGSFPTGVVLSTALSGRDVRTVGSGNSGAANVARTSGIRMGVLVALLDIAKGVIPLVIGLWLGIDHAGLAVAGLAAVLGHDFSVFLRFRGGKGVATTLGACLVLAPIATVIGLVLWLAVMLLWRYSSLASLVSLAVIPIATALTGRPPAYVWLTAGLFLLAVAKHWENLYRLAVGTEQKFQRARPAGGG